MVLGLGSYACAWAIGVPGYPVPAHPLTAEGLIERAARLGLRLVQIADNLPLERLSALEISALRKTASERGIAIELGTRGIDFQHLQTYVALCKALDSKLLRVVVDTVTHKPATEEIVSTLRAAAPMLREAAVTLAIENHDRLRVESLASIVNDIGDSSVGICLDTVNSFGSLEGPEIVLETLATHVVSLHAKDFLIRRSFHQMGFEITGTPAGQGCLDLPWLLRRLRDAKRYPNVILELWPPPEHDLEATITKEWQWCQASIRYLRSLLTD